MLTNEHLNGTDKVVVVNSKLNGETFIETTEGRIIKVHQGDRQGVYATVKIDGDKVDRWIFAHDQPGDENYKEVEDLKTGQQRKLFKLQSNIQF